MSEKLCLRWYDNDSDFADVTLACKESSLRMVNGHQLEAHKVILDGFIPQTTINTHCSKLEDFIFHPKRWLTKVRGRHLRSQKLFYKILKIERRMRNCSTKSWKSRGEREIVQQNLENREEKEKLESKILWTERRKRNDFSKSWKSRGERVLKIHFSSSRGKTKSNFSSRISRDRDSCQGLQQTQGIESITWKNLFS